MYGFRWTVHARCAVIVFFLAFVVAGLAKPVLLLFGIVDFAGAIWTWRALVSTNNNTSAKTIAS